MVMFSVSLLSDHWLSSLLEMESHDCTELNLVGASELRKGCQTSDENHSPTDTLKPFQPCGILTYKNGEMINWCCFQPLSLC